MKKRFKGFTLIECIVALAILGIASLTMAQIYANVSRRNKMNHLVNTSLSNQMAYVEKYTNTQAVPIYYGNTTNKPDSHSLNVKTGGVKGDGAPPHKVSGSLTQKNVLKITKYKDATNLTKEEYSFPTDIYVLKSRDRDDGQLTSDAGYTEDDYNLRYKYIIGHSNTP